MIKTRHFLAKTHPDTYSLDDLKAEGTTVWDGVSNPQAVDAIRQMRKGDIVFIYHSGGESAVVGVARVTGAPAPAANQPKSWTVGLCFQRALARPVPLSAVKACGLFGETNLVRQGRLSTMLLTEALAEWILRYSEGENG